MTDKNQIPITNIYGNNLYSFGSVRELIYLQDKINISKSLQLDFSILWSAAKQFLDSKFMRDIIRNKNKSFIAKLIYQK
jgi:hypothetical protein